MQQAELALTADRTVMLRVAANREVHRLLRDGIVVQVHESDGSLRDERVAAIDWTKPAANDFLSRVADTGTRFLRGMGELLLANGRGSAPDNP